MPASTNQCISLIAVQRVVMSAGFGIWIILTVQREFVRRIGRVPADTLIPPTLRDEHVPLVAVHRVMVITGIGIIQTVNRNRGLYRSHPSDTFIVPAKAFQIIPFIAIRRIEMLAGIRIVHTVHLLGALIRICTCVGPETAIDIDSTIINPKITAQIRFIAIRITTPHFY